jgi:hypothetical protein
MFHAFRTHKLSRLPLFPVLQPRLSSLLEKQEFAAHPHIEPPFLHLHSYEYQLVGTPKVSDTFLRILMLSHRQFQRNCLFLNDWFFKRTLENVRNL